MKGPIEYFRIADLYDTFVKFDEDIDFFINEAKKSKGAILELMCGTGRVSIPLLKAGNRLTCIDCSPDMLAVLQYKLGKHGLSAPTHVCDVRDLEIDQEFNLAIIPLNSFSELLTDVDQLKTLAAIYNHLKDNGRLIITLHNPTVKLKTIDPHYHLMGRYDLEGDKGTLLFWGAQSYDEEEHIVTAIEIFEEYDKQGNLQTKRLVEIQYALISRKDFETHASSGFTIEALYGDYDYSQFSDKKSPYMIWELKKK